ncbi:MAG TPA: hypothetical protein VK929_02035 [Longimicrobiales bacterium]|nr:hypothetical protein [Longimicrobiales bacterium]
MEKHLAYCSALDREVHVYLRPIHYDETDPGNVVTPTVICLEHAEDCLGIHCPLFEGPVDSWVQRFEWFFNRGQPG